MLLKLNILTLLLATCTANVLPKSSEGQPSGPVVSPPVAPSVGSSGPESRQITTGVNGQMSGVSSSLGSNYPYAAMYQNSVYGSGPKVQSAPGASGGWLSFLRPGSSGSGRRSSLTSKLRNIWSNIFKRGESSPYLGSGSSYSFAFRNPPYGYNQGQGQGQGLFGSSSSLGSSSGGSPGNLFGSASSYRPLVYPGFEAAAASGSGSGSSGVASLWNNYKQWASTMNQGAGVSNPLHGHGASSAAANTANYAWSPPAAHSGGSGGYGNQGRYQGGHQGQEQGQGGYQGAASMQYPSIQSQNYNNQRLSSGTGSNSSFKPLSSGAVADKRSSSMINNKPTS